MTVIDLGPSLQHSTIATFYYCALKVWIKTAEAIRILWCTREKSRNYRENDVVTAATISSSHTAWSERRHERWAQINLSLQPFSRLFTAISVSIQCGGLCERQPSSQTGLLPPRASWLACRDAPGACFDLWSGTTWLMVGRYDTIRYEKLLTIFIRPPHSRQIQTDRQTDKIQLTNATNTKLRPNVRSKADISQLNLNGTNN